MDAATQDRQQWIEEEQAVVQPPVKAWDILLWGVLVYLIVAVLILW